MDPKPETSNQKPVTSDQNPYAIIVAGGKGTRMNSEIPKQFMELAGLPVLMHTINAFFHYSGAIRIILVLPEGDIRTWKHLCIKHRFQKPLTLTSGGDSRFESVKNGLNTIPDTDGLVAIHDGVRPLVSADLIGESFRVAAIHQSAIAAIGLKDSIRMTDQNITIAVDRSRYRLIQTPQTFDLKVIKKAYEVNEGPAFTDDASVAERAGYNVVLFEGSYENLKITTPEDLLIAETLLNNRKNKG